MTVQEELNYDFAGRSPRNNAVARDVDFPNFIRIGDPSAGEKMVIFYHGWVRGTELRLPITSAVAELTGVFPQRIETD